MGPVRTWRASDRSGRRVAVLNLLLGLVNLALGLGPFATYWFVNVAAGLFLVWMSWVALRMGVRRNEARRVQSRLRLQQQNRERRQWN